MIYGLPVPGDGPHGGTYKVSHHTPGTALDRFDPTDRAPFADDPALSPCWPERWLGLVPALDPAPVATERCVYDNSADTDFVLDRVGHVVIGCGTSGHGFNFGPLLGELLADLADGTEPPFDLARFALRRAAAEGAPAGSFEPCPATSHCSGASTSPATAASACRSCGSPSMRSATRG